MPPPATTPSPGSRWAVVRNAATATALAVVVYLAATRPDWSGIGHALAEASAPWIVAAALVNVASLLIRGAGWLVCARQATHRPIPLVSGETAFQIGQGVNTVVPGRVGEPVKAYVLNRRLGGGADGFSALLGSVVVHRMMDVIPLVVVTGVVLAFGQLEGALRASVVATVAVSVAGLLVAARLAARPGRLPRSRRAAELLHAAREGFMVLRVRGPFLRAAVLESVGWSVQIGVVWLGFAAFGIDAGPVAAAAVLIATNAATLVPLWPGNVGLVQVAVALALHPWGVDQTTGVAYGLALQGAEIVSALLLAAVAMAVEGLGVRDLLRRDGPETAPQVR